MKWYCIIDARYDGGGVEVFDNEFDALEYARMDCDCIMVVKGEEVKFEK